MSLIFASRARRPPTRARSPVRRAQRVATVFELRRVADQDSEEHRQQSVDDDDEDDNGPKGGHARPCRRSIGILFAFTTTFANPRCFAIL
jgi:hypothetical protein